MRLEALKPRRVSHKTADVRVVTLRRITWVGTETVPVGLHSAEQLRRRPNEGFDLLVWVYEQ